MNTTGRKFGGRQKGTPNKATAARVAEIAATGETPLAFMLRVMRDESKEFAVRLDAAKGAAPYVHPKLATIEHTGKDGGPIETADVSDNEFARRLAFILEQGLRTQETTH